MLNYSRAKLDLAESVTQRGSFSACPSAIFARASTWGSRRVRAHRRSLLSFPPQRLVTDPQKSFFTAGAPLLRSWRAHEDGPCGAFFTFCRGSLSKVEVVGKKGDSMRWALRCTCKESCFFGRFHLSGLENDGVEFCVEIKQEKHLACCKSTPRHLSWFLVSNPLPSAP